MLFAIELTFVAMLTTLLGANIPPNGSTTLATGKGGKDEAVGQTAAMVIAERSVVKPGRTSWVAGQQHACQETAASQKDVATHDLQWAAMAAGRENLEHIMRSMKTDDRVLVASHNTDTCDMAMELSKELGLKDTDCIRFG